MHLPYAFEKWYLKLKCYFNQVSEYFNYSNRLSKKCLLSETTYDSKNQLKVGTKSPIPKVELHILLLKYYHNRY